MKRQYLPPKWKFHPVDELNTEDKGPCFHMKFILLSFKTHLRFCLLTGNMKRGDDWHVSENSALIFDAPRIPSSSRSTGEDDVQETRGELRTDFTSTPALNPSFSLGEDFQNQLILMLDSVRFSSTHPTYQEIKSKHFDFSKVPFQLVFSEPTPILEKNPSWELVERVGIGRLKRIMRDWKFDVGRTGVKIEAQVSLQN